MKPAETIERSGRTMVPPGPIDAAPLCDLIARIPHEPAAHDEFHNHRTIFLSHSGNGSRILFIEKAHELCAPNALRRYGVAGIEMVDRVRDELCDRFTVRFGGGHQEAGPHRNFVQIDAEISHWRADHPAASDMEIERAAVVIANRVVMRHYLHAVRTGLRSRSPARSRYRWVIVHRDQTTRPRPDRVGDGKSTSHASQGNDSIHMGVPRCADPSSSNGQVSNSGGGVIEVWMPRTLSGRQRGRWLEQHVPAPDPSRPGEAQRVQTIIDRLLGPRHLLPLDVQDDGLRIEVSALQTLLGQEIEQRSLARVVGDEKAGRLRELRPSIRTLGRGGVRRLVSTIFEAIVEDDYHDGRIAESFGLSAAAMSRFAGSRWRPDCGREVPDLWANLAGVLLEHPGFRSLLTETGLLATVAAVRQPQDGGD